MTNPQSPIPDMPSGELRTQIRDIINHIDNPYRLFGLGVENEGYGKASATDAIMQLIEDANQQKVQETLTSGFQSLRERIDSLATYNKGFRVIHADDLIKSIDDTIATLARKLGKTGEEK